MPQPLESARLVEQVDRLVRLLAVVKCFPGRFRRRDRLLERRVRDRQRVVDLEPRSARAQDLERLLAPSAWTSSVWKRRSSAASGRM
jgi:hypothetical protein